MDELKKDVIETRTLEQLLKDLREEKEWSCLDVAHALNKTGIFVNANQVKKWELGRFYPKKDVLYKLQFFQYICCWRIFFLIWYFIKGNFNFIFCCFYINYYIWVLSLCGKYTFFFLVKKKSLYCINL